jgi:hypothetical protein
MQFAAGHEECHPIERETHRGCVPMRDHRSRRKRMVPNETPVPLAPDELAPDLRVIRPSRSSLTYDRME